jgi:hypothetical protein
VFARLHAITDRRHTILHRFILNHFCGEPCVRPSSRNHGSPPYDPSSFHPQSFLWRTLCSPVFTQSRIAAIRSFIVSSSIIFVANLVFARPHAITDRRYTILHRFILNRFCSEPCVRPLNEGPRRRRPPQRPGLFHEPYRRYDPTHHS